MYDRSNPFGPMIFIPNRRFRDLIVANDAITNSPPYPFNDLQAIYVALRSNKLTAGARRCRQNGFREVSKG